jgi:MFS family permease
MSGTTPPARSSRLRAMARALRHRNYRLFFAGQSLSLIGTWLTQIATSWLVYRLTGSALLLGVVSFASQAPTFFLAPIAGVWLEHARRRDVLVCTQALAMLQSGLLAFFALSGTIDVPHVLALAAFQGVITAIDMPARQAFVSELVGSRADLANAVALNSSMVHAARLVGPSIGGFLIAWVGEGYCFLIDAVSYVAVLGSLFAMRIPPRARAELRLGLWKELRSGFVYAAQFAPIRTLLSLLAITSLVGMPYSVLMPVLAREILHGEASTLGALMAASGFGALTGALYLASRHSVLGLGRVIAATSLAFGAALAGLAASRSIGLTLAISALAGGTMMVQMAASNTVLQTIVDEDKRGRVMSFFAMAVFGTMPFGSLLSGALAERIGAPLTLVCGGACCMLAALAFARVLPALREHVRPVYQRLGILPEIASGVAEATRASAPPPK